ncbi:MAG: redoxin domain-containing protein [Acidimicrobiia bacterium]|nr:redoxin domain-containing protein [Acidimicrobiia bacterium]
MAATGVAATPRRCRIGEQAPWFAARCTSPVFHFDQMAGRVTVLSFLGSAGLADSARILADLHGRHRGLFDDVTASFFAVTVDPEDARLQRVAHALPGIRVFWDHDQQVCRRYAVSGPAERHTLVLDQRLRVVEIVPFDDRPETHLDRVAAAMARVPTFAPPSVAQPQAPALVIPDVFEPVLCQHLMDTYERQGGRESGFMRDVEGRTVEVLSAREKRRRDTEVVEEGLRSACLARVRDRIVPEIARSFQFHVTRIERYIVACYDEADAGFFRRHRDNTTRATAHRRFACTINLNTGEYEGGELLFPEFGAQRFVAPVGGAVVFSCSLLHEALPVTQGRRFAFLPFLYDDAGAAQRQATARFLEPAS